VPLVQIEIAEGYSAEVHRQLHERIAEVVSELLSAPLPSIRICITQHRLPMLSVGGVPLSDHGEAGAPGNPAALQDRPLVHVWIVEGRTLAARRQWHERTARAMAEILDVPLAIVRTCVTEMSVEGWAIAGVPYAVARKDQLATMREPANSEGESPTERSSAPAGAA
jgi:4-oxalocrotonate tautomerase family enzyme